MLTFAPTRSVQSVAQALRLILLHELQLDDTRVNFYNQKFQIPPDEQLFLVIEALSTKILSSRSTTRYNAQTGDVEETQDLATQERYVIGAFSRNLDATNRKDEVVMALGSVYAQQVQEAHSCKIARIAPIADLSSLEGAARLSRYDIAVAVLAWRQKRATTGYYDTFATDVWTTPCPT